MVLDGVDEKTMKKRRKPKEERKEKKYQVQKYSRSQGGVWLGQPEPDPSAFYSTAHHI